MDDMASAARGYSIQDGMDTLMVMEYVRSLHRSSSFCMASGSPDASASASSDTKTDTGLPNTFSRIAQVA